MHRSRHFGVALVAGTLATLATPAEASCGSAFCLVNTDWSSQAAFSERGARFDLRYEAIDLDQPRHGRHDVAIGQIARHHDEVETTNRNWIAGIDWTLAPAWGISLTVPYLDRDHRHIHNHRGAQIVETWSYRELGDARVMARHELATTQPNATTLRSYGLTFGVKLPTGKHDVANDEGEIAERTLQPGTGTTDALIGAYLHGVDADSGWSWFTRAQAVLPVSRKDGYKPGRQLQLDAGVRYALGADVGLMVQANYLAKGRDSGANAEPEDSGQRQLWLSPGISWIVAKGVQLYAFVQLPAYQAVNGVQLTADWSALAGVSLRF